VHEHRHACPIIGTQSCTVSVPVRAGLLDLVGAFLAVHSVNVRYEQGAVVFGHACVNVQITRTVTMHTSMSRGTLL
jgi:hypothetical protein